MVLEGDQSGRVWRLEIWRECLPTTGERWTLGRERSVASCGWLAARLKMRSAAKR